MQTLFFTLIAFVAIILLMSIGFIIKKQSLKGSCGGLSTLGIAKACDCDKPCDTFQSKLDAGDEQAKAEYEQKFAKKDDDSQFYEVK
ncbi:(Na+)-NQR maturation NqrM [Haemophilus influenzae]|uniref:(Na+)-NQR maturation NqrM n=1 Tax=Haemophilus influenzae TaxID=727 RepID=UPI0034DA0B0B